MKNYNEQPHAGYEWTATCAFRSRNIVTLVALKKMIEGPRLRSARASVVQQVLPEDSNVVLFWGSII